SRGPARPARRSASTRVPSRRGRQRRTRTRRRNRPMPHCPVCRVQADPISYEGVRIYNCGQCGGHWLSDARLDVILERRDVAMPEPVRQKMMDLADASHTSDTLLCMTCGREMRKERFKYWDDIQLDRCPKCNGLWLDRGELEKCQIYWE